MIDLKKVPLADLKAEVERRMELERAARKKAAEEKACCKNCAYRIFGRTSYGKIQGYESLVCYKKPKKFKNYFNDGPKYNQAYYACSPVIKGCEMFVHKNSAEGIKIRKKLSPMTDKIE